MTEDNNTNERLTRLESDAPHIQTDLAEIKVDIHRLDTKIDKRCDALDAKIDKRCDALDAKIDKLDTKIDSTFKWMLGTMLGCFLFLLGAMGTGYFSLNARMLDLSKDLTTRQDKIIEELRALAITVRAHGTGVNNPP